MSGTWSTARATRLHRITGQEKGETITAGDPWTGIGSQAVAAVARKTMESLANWVT